jgi:hypothetical protein
MASSGLQHDTRPGKASLAAAFGYYKGQSGLAVGLGYAVTSRVGASARSLSFTLARDTKFDQGKTAAQPPFRLARLCEVLATTTPSWRAALEPELDLLAPEIT